jgi:hypothetical protein
MNRESDWPAAGDAIRARMQELRMTTAALARETGLSETTIRYLGQPGTRRNRSALVAISAVLRWRYDHLTNILHGEPQKNVRIRPPVDILVERALAAALGPVQEEIASLRPILEELRTGPQAPGRACGQAT